jgi:hypothetical protein
MSFTFTKFQCFVENLAEQGHKLDTDTLKIALTNTAPTAASDTVFDPGVGHLHPAPVAANNYAPTQAVQSASAQTGGTYKLTCADVVFTATVGGIGPFRYAILYYDTSATDLLIGFYDYGSSITLASGETFTVSFDQSNGVLTLT